MILVPYPLQEKGVKGATVLALHKPYDMSTGIAIDDLHAIFLGVTLALLRYWFDPKHRSSVFSIRSQVCCALYTLGWEVKLCTILIFRSANVMKFCYESKYLTSYLELLGHCKILRNGRVSFSGSSILV